MKNTPNPRTTIKVGLFLLITFTLLTSGKINAQIVELGIIRDVSKSLVEPQPFDADDIFRQIVIDLELKDSKVGVNLYTALCGWNTIPEVRLASLPEIDGWFPSVSERNQAIGQFLMKGKSDIDYLAQQPCDQNQTNLYRTLAVMAKAFRSEPTTKTLIIFSDLREESSVFRTSEYSKEPSGLIDDYDSIIEAFERDSPLPDLSGFTIILITPGNSEELLWASRLWTKLLTSCKAEVQVRAAFE